MTRKTPQEIHAHLSALLARHLVDPSLPSFYLWERPDRAIASVNPANVKNLQSILSDSFVHNLSTVLGGVPVVKTNSRGVFFQIGYSPLPPARLDPQPLNLLDQRAYSPTHLPFGVTKAGPLWLPLADVGSVLIGGARRMGKTRLVHAWIQALAEGGQAEIWVYDGKNSLEFGRYAGFPHLVVISNLLDSLALLHQSADSRAAAFSMVNATSLPEFNQRVPASSRVSPIVLIVDEAATISPDEANSLSRLIAWGGAHGIHPVIISQRTGVDQVSSSLKTNLQTRICFPVPSASDSVVVLAHSGAEKLPKIPGRFLFEWGGKMIPVQSFTVDLPGVPLLSPSDLALATRALNEKNGRVSIQILQSWGASERDARSLLDAWQSRGWLDGGGQGASRRLSPSIQALICQSVKVPSKCQSSCQSVKVAEEPLK